MVAAVISRPLVLLWLICFHADGFVRTITTTCHRTICETDSYHRRVNGKLNVYLYLNE